MPTSARPSLARFTRRLIAIPTPSGSIRRGGSTGIAFRAQAGDWSFDEADFRIRWYADGQLNLSVNCLDRHLAARGDKVAIDLRRRRARRRQRLTYREVHAETCRFANLLKSRGIKRGDRVMIYMPMIPEAAAAMLACARIGAVHSVCFGGFSPESLAGRIADCGAIAVITADEGVRGGKRIPLKVNVDAALDKGDVATVIVVTRTGADVPMKDGRDISFSAVRDALSTDCPAEVMDAEDPLVHPLHLGLDRKAQGRRPHHRRLFGVGGDDLRLDFRRPREGHLLVHRRRRLDHRPHLCRLRPADERRDQRDVRRGPQLPRSRPLLGDASTASA